MFREGVGLPVLRFAIATMLFVGGYMFWLSLGSKTYGVAGLPKLEQAFASVPVPAGVQRVGEIASVSRYVALHVSAKYTTSQSAESIRAHYGFWLEKNGWTLRSASSDSRTYCKGTLDAYVGSQTIAGSPGYYFRIHEQAGRALATGC